MKPKILILILFANFLWLTCCANVQAQDVIVVSSLPENLEREIDLAYSEYLKNDIDYVFSSLENYKENNQSYSGLNGRESQAQTHVTAGYESCLFLASIASVKNLLCTLLSSRSFTTILESELETTPSAIVINQPISRQVAVAQKTYPALKSFGVLAVNKPILLSENAEKGSIWFTPYRSDLSLLSQLQNTLKRVDSIVAVPDQEIYSTSKLRTVLLTAYGYGKPIIGYGKAYVRAGSLISAYTTPTQIVRQVSEQLLNNSKNQKYLDSGISYPKYFSVAANASVATSLNLYPAIILDDTETFQDEDFSQ